MGNLTQDFPITETLNEMIVHQSSSLHVRIDDRRADETESPPLEILAECLGFGRSRRDLCRSFPAIEFGLPADEPPAVGIKVAELFPNLEKRAGVAHRGFDLHAITDDLRISDKGLDSFAGIMRDLLGIEFVERVSIAIALLQYERPVQSGLR